jgi:hypothetical protein
MAMIWSFWSRNRGKTDMTSFTYADVSASGSIVM